MIRSLIAFVFFLTSIVVGAQTSSPTQDEINRAYYQRQFQKPGCLEAMVNQTSQNLSSQYEVQQQITNNLMGVADAYFEHQKTCDANVYKHLEAFRSEKLRHELEKNKISGLMKKNEIALKKAILAVKRDCQATANENFVAFKGQTTTGVVGANQGGVSSLVGRTKNINKFRKLFYDDCMADPLNIEAVQISGMEMRANVQELEANLKSSADTMVATTEKLKANQEFEIQQCVKGEEQLKYREALLANQNAAAQSLTKKQNLMGLLGAGFTCLQGIMAPPSDATGSRSLTSE